MKHIDFKRLRKSNYTSHISAKLALNWEINQSKIEILIKHRRFAISLVTKTAHIINRIRANSRDHVTTRLEDKSSAIKRLIKDKCM